MPDSAMNRRDLELLLIGLGEKGEIGSSLGGITRLQKYLFLLEREEGVGASGDGFAFEPFKAGPYSSRIYDDLEFLENLGLIESRVTGNTTEAEAAELEALTFDDLFNEGDDGERGADSFEERRFKLTDKGVAHLQKLLSDPAIKQVADGIRRVKSRYSSYALSDLLYHVYTKYPEMATESEIRSKVLRRGRSG